MKRLLVFAPVCLVLAALLVGCDDDAANDTSNTSHTAGSGNHRGSTGRRVNTAGRNDGGRVHGN